ncbi:MAG: LamG domain-containing protein, partial [Opitutales bacterium]
GQIASIEMPSEPFFGAADVAHRSMEEAQRRYAEWVSLSEDLANDRRTALYFTFDDQRDWHRALLDVANLKKKPEHGAIVGCDWIDGRWPGKGALRFSGPNDRVRLKLGGRLPSITLSTWMRLDRLHKEFNPIVHLSSEKKGAVSWGIDGRGRMRLRVNEDSGSADYTSSIIFRSDQIGRWVHLAVTYDSKQAKVTHYLDGLYKGSENLRGEARLSLDGGELGNLASSGKGSSRGGNLRGAIDEFIVLRQALAAEEIRRLYEIGRPFSMPRLNQMP